MTEPDFSAFRDQFPALEQRVWLNTPTAAPASRPVLASLRAQLDRWVENGQSWGREDTAAFRARDLMADLLGVTPSSVALMGSMAEAAATVAGSLGPGDVVVVGEGEFRANLLPFVATEIRGVTVRRVPMAHGVLRTDDLLAALTNDVTFVALSVVQSASGSRTDEAAVADRCRAIGTRLFLDATQSAGVLRLDPAVDADYVGTHGYKWLLGPRGGAFLAVRPDRVDGLPLLVPNPLSTPDRAMYGDRLDLAEGARRFDTPLVWPSWSGTAAGLELLATLPPAAVEQRALNLAEQTRTGARAQGITVLPSDGPSHIVGLRGVDDGSLVDRLRAADIDASVRAGTLRLGFHAFNQPNDVDRVLAHLAPVT